MSSATVTCRSGEVMTGIGPVTVRQPRVRDREADAADPDRIRFSPSILPPYMRRSKSMETLLPILYLKGISTGDFSEALAALLGKDAAGLSASAIGRLKDGWLDEHTAWQKRDLSAKRYVYIWADGIHLQARLEDEKQCIIVLIGATPEGRERSPRKLEDRLGMRRIFALKHDRLSTVPRLPHLRIKFNASQKRHAKLLRHVLRATARKDIDLMVAVRTNEIAHVLDHAHQIDFHLAKHFDGLARILQRNIGRC